MEQVLNSCNFNYSTETPQLRLNKSTEVNVVKEEKKSQARKCDQQCQSDVRKGKPKRLRTIFTSNQLVMLEREFAINRYLYRGRRLDIAQRVGVDERKVKIWFQNRRMKSKRYPGADDSYSNIRPSSLPSSIASQESESSSVSVAQNEIESMASTCIVKEEPQEHVEIKHEREMIPPNQGDSILSAQEQWIPVEQEHEITSNQRSMIPWHYGNMTNATYPYHMYQPQHNPHFMYYGQQRDFRPHFQHHPIAYQDAPFRFGPHCNNIYAGNAHRDSVPNGDFCQMQRFVSQEPQPINNWSPPANYSEEYFQKTFWDNLINSVEL